MANESVSVSERVYRLLLVVYPLDFRREYGRDMTQVFRDRYGEERRRRGIFGVIGLWAHTLLDLGRTAPAEHLRQAGERAGGRLVAVVSLTLLLATAVQFLIWTLVVNFVLRPAFAAPTVGAEAFWDRLAFAIAFVVFGLVFASGNFLKLRARRERLARSPKGVLSP